MPTNHTDAFISLMTAYQNMITDWQTTSIKAFVAAIASYLFGVQNWELLFILLIAIAIDTLLGMAKALKLREFSSKGMGKTLYKVPLYTMVLMMTHIAVHVVNINSGIDLGMMDAGAYMFLILREMKGSTEKLTFFGLNFTLPIKALENLISKNSDDSKTDGKGRGEE